MHRADVEAAAGTVTPVDRELALDGIDEVLLMMLAGDWSDDLEADQDFLKAGGVFTDDLITTWISYKRLNEIDAVRLRPHPGSSCSITTYR